MLALRKALGVVVSVLALVGMLVTALLVLLRVDHSPRTDDAYLQAYIVNMAPDVSGRIAELNVCNNEKVQRDQVPFRIDPEPYPIVRGTQHRTGDTHDDQGEALAHFTHPEAHPAGSSRWRRNRSRGSRRSR